MNLKILIICIFFICNKTSAWNWNRVEDGVKNTVETLEKAADYVGKSFSELAAKVGKKLTAWNKNDGINADELSNYDLGDMLFGHATTDQPSKNWPEGKIPYVITGSFDSSERSMIMNAMNDFHEHTCLRFVPRTSEQLYIRIASDYSGCHSYVGYTGTVYNVNLQSPGCLTMKGTVVHELMHAAGFIHEQSREDRDQYVTIKWQNIWWWNREQFRKYPSDYTDQKYDYGSVMHYSKNTFSWNGYSPTLVSKTDPSMEMGQRIGLSEYDIEKINKKYNCPNRSFSRSNHGIVKNTYDDNDNPDYEANNWRNKSPRRKYYPEEHGNSRGNSNSPYGSGENYPEIYENSRRNSNSAYGSRENYPGIYENSRRNSNSAFNRPEYNRRDIFTPTRTYSFGNYNSRNVNEYDNSNSRYLRRKPGIIYKNFNSGNVYYRDTDENDNYNSQYGNSRYNYGSDNSDSDSDSDSRVRTYGSSISSPNGGLTVKYGYVSY